MRIAVIGNCQVETISPVLKLITAGDEISTLHNWNIKTNFPDQESFHAYIDSFDICFCQDFYNIDGLDPESVFINTRAVRFPIFYFDAFHPDCVYVFNHDKQVAVKTDLSQYNSALAAYLYVAGFSPADTIKAFRGEVFSALGFLDRWDSSCTVLEQEFKACGLKLGDFIARWMRAGPFMHSCNHPSLNAIYDVCLFFMKRAGAVKMDVGAPERYIQDSLLKYAVWPVYPEIASSFGFRGNYCFKSEDTGGGGGAFDLSTFIEHSFHHYRESELTSLRDSLYRAWDEGGMVEKIREAI